MDNSKHYFGDGARRAGVIHEKRHDFGATGGNAVWLPKSVKREARRPLKTPADLGARPWRDFHFGGAMRVLVGLVIIVAWLGWVIGTSLGMLLIMIARWI